MRHHRRPGRAAAVASLPRIRAAAGHRYRERGRTASCLATGGDLKTTFCLMGSDGHAHMSSHLGDMADPRTQGCFESALEHLAFMTDRRPQAIARDMHPGYATTAWARRYAADRPVIAVQHHHAHAVSLLAEHRRLGTPVIAVTYDGTGYGTDGTIWGGELLAVDRLRRGSPGSATCARSRCPAATARCANPPGSRWTCCSRAGVEWDRRPAAGGRAGRELGLHILRQQIPRGLGCAATTSMGRLFDAVASLLGRLPAGHLRGPGRHRARTPGPARAAGGPRLRGRRRCPGSRAGDRRDRRRAARRRRRGGPGRRFPRGGDPRNGHGRGRVRAGRRYLGRSG